MVLAFHFIGSTWLKYFKVAPLRPLPGPRGGLHVSAYGATRSPFAETQPLSLTVHISEIPPLISARHLGLSDTKVR